MRDILFRARVEFNGVMNIDSFVYGYYTPVGKYHYLRTIDNKQYKIDSNTLGQYTGCIDCNNVKIFEHDILDCTLWVIHPVHNEKVIHSVFKGVVVYDECQWVVKDEARSKYFLRDILGHECTLQIVGNIFDSKE